MRAWVIRIGIALVFNAITFWAASILPGVRLGGGFLWAVVVFTAATLLIKPGMTALIAIGGASLLSRSRRSGKLLSAAAGLLATLGILIVTSIFSSGFQINGIAGWVAATVVIWLASLIYNFVDDGLEARVTALIGRAGISRRRQP
ncbi:hypothetical protein [Arthrobacter sp. MMS18-M83]|uniref:hypothetical protein n=1 Tax=Arthrobacter sp. MMS18-M83 TaxID=2996261 RepID=UPI00227B1F8A|nr:hypothetical protein [Arthrobacter sp. MMS18-M83]WAH96698.1 hypothetical protein OW521_20300 [Arthrobacter sp. MMS18-M83]